MVSRNRAQNIPDKRRRPQDDKHFKLQDDSNMMLAPALIMPETHKGFDVYCDASRLGLGGVLMQEGRAPRQLRIMSWT